MLEADPKISKFEKHIRFMQFQLNEAKSDRQATGVKVYVYYGNSGTGKTFSAINLYAPDGDYFKLDCTSVKSGSLWFDGYEGQKVLILDDFDAEVCSVSFLKNLLDKYKLRLQVKGGHTWAAWNTVVVTSNQHPRHWWNLLDAVQIDALKRRITEIRHYTQMGVYQIEEWNTDPVGDFVNELVVPKPIEPIVLAQDTPPASPIDVANAATQPLVYATQDEIAADVHSSPFHLNASFLDEMMDLSDPSDDDVNAIAATFIDDIASEDSTL